MYYNCWFINLSSCVCVIALISGTRSDTEWVPNIVAEWMNEWTNENNLDLLIHSPVIIIFHFTLTLNLKKYISYTYKCRFIFLTYTSRISSYKYIYIIFKERKYIIYLKLLCGKDLRYLGFTWKEFGNQLSKICKTSLMEMLFPEQRRW